MPVGRNILSYPMAPMLAFAIDGSANALVMIMVLGVMAATAIPAFEKYKHEAEQRQQQPAVQQKEKAEAESIRGGRFTWHMRTPGPKWEAIPEAQAREQNAAADRWLTRPDVDAHLLVIGEYTGGSPLSMDAFARGVIANMKRTSKKFKVLHEEDRPDGVRLITAESMNEGQMVQHLYELRLEGDYAYQLLALAPAPAMPKVKAEMLSAMNSFAVD
jgi:hypothetical protein